MAKKKTTGPNTADNTAPVRRTRAAATRKPTVRPDPGVAEPGATPPASEPLDAAGLGNGSGSLDRAASERPSYHEIAEAAYQRYLRRGGQHGRDFEDWLEAERSLRSQS